MENKHYPIIDVVRETKYLFTPPIHQTTPCCPFCGGVLTLGEPRRLETLNEHCFPQGEIPLKPTGYCLNIDCVGGKHFMWCLSKFESCGEAYYQPYHFEHMPLDENNEIPERSRWPLDILEEYETLNNYYHSATNTEARKHEIMINRHFNGVQKIMLHPYFGFNKVRFYIEVNKHVDDYGNIHGSSYRLKILTKKGADNFVYGGHFYYTRWKYNFKRFKYCLKYKHKNPFDEGKCSTNKIDKLFYRIMSVFYPTLYNKSRMEQNK